MCEKIFIDYINKEGKLEVIMSSLDKGQDFVFRVLAQVVLFITRVMISWRTYYTNCTVAIQQLTLLPNKR